MQNRSSDDLGVMNGWIVPFCTEYLLLDSERIKNIPKETASVPAVNGVKWLLGHPILARQLSA